LQARGTGGQPQGPAIWIGFCDSDDLWELTKRMSHLDASPHIECHAGSSLIDDNGKLLCYGYQHPRSTGIDATHGNVTRSVTSAPVTCRAVF
jgi:hypothetical protein